LIAPEMGGPVSAPIDMMLVNMPRRLLTSPLTPMVIIGKTTKEMYVPEENPYRTAMIIRDPLLRKRGHMYVSIAAHAVMGIIRLRGP